MMESPLNDYMKKIKQRNDLHPTPKKSVGHDPSEQYKKLFNKFKKESKYTSSSNPQKANRTEYLSFDDLEEAVSKLEPSLLSELLINMISKIPGTTLQHIQGMVYLHIVLHQLNVYDPNQRTKLVTKIASLFDERSGQFSNEKTDLINKMRDIVLEYDNLLRAESIMNVLEKESRDGDKQEQP